MTSFSIVFEILFLILIANSIDSINWSQRRASAELNHQIDLIGNRADYSSKQNDAKATEGHFEQSPSDQSEEVASEPFDESSKRVPSKGERGSSWRWPRRRKRDIQDLTLVASSSGLIQTTTIAPQSHSPSEMSPAELCYLANGGSSLTLTVNEATQVGSVIGTIDVNGEPSLENGNVDLMDGLDQATAGVREQLGSGGGGGASAESFVSSAIGRQNRRLFGRRDTSSSRPSELEPTTTTTSSFYSLVAAGSTVTVTPILSSSPPSVSSSTVATLVPAVRVQPGTKNLILARPLDKESAEGETSQLVNVRCRPRHSIQATALTNSNGDIRSRRQQQSTSFTTIPIRLIITDANDHAPEFVGQLPYVINISETTPINSIVSRDILALDKDSAGPHSTIHYRVLEADEQQHSAPQLASHFAFANPLEPILTLTSPLDYESLPSGSFMLSIVAQDQGEPEPMQSIAQVQVNVLDFDDQNPRFLDEKYTLLMDETQSSLVGQNLRIMPRNLRAEDGDRGINAPIVYSFDVSVGINNHNNRPTFEMSPQIPVNDAEEPAENIERYLHLNPTSGELRLIRQWPPLATASSSLTLVVRATQADNRDRYALTTLTIIRSNQASASGPNLSYGNSQTGQTSSASVVPKQGIEFAQERLMVQVPEDTAVNEKIARVKANHLQSQPQPAQQVDARQLPNAVVNGNSSQLRSRPINYQLLDDQTDQFAINGLGEIFLRQSLDYEQRQEFKIRVLATYTKYSDVCHVQVNVLNVNDNKPKFAQAQYSFQLTESRLRSNSIGLVQANDADLNDTIHYSLLDATNSQQAHLFDIGPTGQISLRPGQRQFNVSHCQLLVQARDSLGPISGRHTQQARVNIYVAPQIVGRSLNLNQERQLDQGQALLEREPAGLHHSQYTLSQSISSQPTAVTGADWTTQRKTSGRDSNQRLLKDNNLIRQSLAVADSSTAPSYQRRNQHQLELAASSQTGGRQQTQPVQANSTSQRSSLATVMASLQHMMKSVNFFEMPISSALLLSVLLTFLVCLLLIVVISMSVHVYRLTSKARSRRHQHKRLTAAARLRHHAQLSAAAAAAAAAAAGVSQSSSSNTSPYNSAASSTSSCSSSQLPPQPKPKFQTTTGQSTNQIGNNQQQTDRNGNRLQNYYDNLALTPNGNANDKTVTKQVEQKQPSLSLASSRATVTSSSSNSAAGRLSLASSPSPLLVSAPATSAGANSSNGGGGVGGGKRRNAAAKRPANSESAAGQRKRNELAAKATADSKQFGALKISISNETTDNNSAPLEAAATYLLESNVGLNKQNPLYLEPGAQQTTGGNLSNNSLVEHKLQSAGTRKKPINKSPSVFSATTDDDDDNSSVVNCGHYSVNGTMEHQNKLQVHFGDKQLTPSSGGARNKCDALETAISKLVRQHEQELVKDKLTFKPNELHQTPVGDSYRRLSLVDSLVRPVKSQPQKQPTFGHYSNNKVAPAERVLKSTSSHQKRASQCQETSSSGLMAMVRNEIESAAAASEQQIKWPSESIPQRIKKLTWDDELSCCDEQDNNNDSISLSESNSHPASRMFKARGDQDDEECYISPDVKLGSGPGNLERELHRYKEMQNNGGGQNSTVAHQNQFLFSLSNHMLPSLNQRTPQQVAATFTDDGGGGQHRLPSSSVHYLEHLFDDHQSDMTLTSHVGGRNQNNCLDYTIVNDSQFQADSLASSVQLEEATGGQTGGQQMEQQQNERYFIRVDSDNFSTAQQTDNRANQMGERSFELPSDHLNGQLIEQQQSLTSNGQTNVTFKLNQNYQDLKLMTTAIL